MTIYLPLEHVALFSLPDIPSRRVASTFFVIAGKPFYVGTAGDRISPFLLLGSFSYVYF